ncbi:hypothetical protein X975_06048, partial [Stegodyphus mimosarum]
MTKFTNNKTIIPKQKCTSKKKIANNAMHNWLNINKENNNSFKLINNKIKEKPKTWESLEEKLLSSSGIMFDTLNHSESKLMHTETELHDHGNNTHRKRGNRNLSKNKSESRISNLFTNIPNDKPFTQDKVVDITEGNTSENNNIVFRKSKLKSSDILKKSMKAMDRSVILYHEKMKSPQPNEWSENKDSSINSFSERHNNTVLQIQSSMLLAVKGSKMLKQTSEFKENYVKENTLTGFETKWPLPPARKSNRTHSIKVREESEIKNTYFKLDSGHTKGKDNSILNKTEFNVLKYSSPKTKNSHKNRYHKDRFKRKCAGDAITTKEESIAQEKQKITDEIINSFLEDIETKVTCNESCSKERVEKNYNITVAKCGLNQQGKNKQKTFKKNYVNENEISTKIKTTKENNTG